MISDRPAGSACPSPSNDGPTFLHGALIASGEILDARIEDGRIVALGTLRPAAGDDVVELGGYLLVPSLIEAHTHLDKAFLAERTVNESGDLAGAIRAMAEPERLAVSSDITERALRAALLFLRHGVTAVRTHVSCGGTVGFRALEAVVAVKRLLAGRMDLQIVAQHIGPPPGRSWQQQRDQVHKAYEIGASVVGGTPHLDPDPASCMAVCLEEARNIGCAVDFHMDETIDRGSFWLPKLLSLVAEAAPHGQITVSHCVGLAMQEQAVIDDMAAMMARLAVSVVALPQTNLYLQSVTLGTLAPRGVAPIKPLLDAGVVVAGGCDNIRDPFNPLGRADPLETAALLVAVAHLSPKQALDAVTCAPRRVMGLPGTGIHVGAVADLLAIEAASLPDAVAGASESRLVWKAGTLVSVTHVESRIT